MAFNDSLAKRVQFSDFEKSLLFELVSKYPIVTDKRTKHVFNEQKQAAWEALLKDFLARSPRPRPVTTKQLRKLYSNLKGTSKKENGVEVWEQKDYPEQPEHSAISQLGLIFPGQFADVGPMLPSMSPPVRRVEKRKESSSREREQAEHEAKMMIYETQKQCLREEHASKLELYELQKQLIRKQLNN